MREKTCKGKALKDFANGIQIGYWSEVCEIDFGEPGFLRTGI